MPDYYESERLRSPLFVIDPILDFMIAKWWRRSRWPVSTRVGIQAPLQPRILLFSEFDDAMSDQQFTAVVPGGRIARPDAEPTLRADTPWQIDCRLSQFTYGCADQAVDFQMQIEVIDLDREWAAFTRLFDTLAGPFPGGFTGYGRTCARTDGATGKCSSAPAP